MSTSANNALHNELTVPRGAAAPLCPVDRLPMRRRNRICIRIIAIGMLNFLVFTVFYAALGGDAHNGERRSVQLEGGGERYAFFVRGHHIRSLAGRETEVSRTLWIYSYIHSISVLLTSCAMIISMLVLARPHILATMRDGAIAGRTFVTVFGTIVVLVTSFAVILFVWNFVTQLASG